MSSDKEDTGRSSEAIAEEREAKIRAHVRKILQKLKTLKRDP